MNKIQVESSSFTKFIRSKLFRNLVLVIGIFAVLQILQMVGILNSYYTVILINISIMIMAAASLSLATGFLGQLALGHAGFMAIGAYTAALIAIQLQALGIPDIITYVVSLIAAAILSFIFGLIIGTPALRLRGDYLGIMTLGFGEIIKVIITNLSFTGGGKGLPGIPRLVNFPLAYFTMIVVIMIIMLFIKSRHGRAIVSIREDEIASESVGINITRYKILGFSISAMLGGVAGGVMAFQISYLAPTLFGFMKSVEIFIIVVLGGMGSLTGTVLSATILTYLPEALRDFASYRYFIYSIILILMMIYRPQGLLGMKEFSFTSFLKKGRHKWENRSMKEGKSK